MTLGIFEGIQTYYVVTNAPPFGDSPTQWNNPFLTGQPLSVVRFDP
jgi:hypothetical protein